ncbi:MAG: ubiquinol-cytochrome c reductase iron-sulfur subunit [Cyanobacteria bacterium P01_F01_bin.13]
MKRREFINFVGLGILASSLPVAIAACKSTETVSDTSTEGTIAPANETPRSDGFAKVGTVTDLETKGFLTKKGLAAGPVIIIRDPANADNVIALNSKCTHQGCTVDWEGDEFSCACHGSKFAADGTATVGPAVNPLEAYEAMLEGETVLVKAS